MIYIDKILKSKEKEIAEWLNNELKEKPRCFKYSGKPLSINGMHYDDMIIDDPKGETK